MSTPRHPDTGQFTLAAGLPTGDLVNAHLSSKPDAPGAPCPPVPDVPDHDTAMSTGNEAYANLPEDTGGGEQGLSS